MGTELFLRVFRHFYLEEIDQAWVEHLTNMEHLRDGIGLRGYGQRDPKQEYKKEGYDIFVDDDGGDELNVATKLFKAQVRKDTDIERMEREDLEHHAAQQRAMQLRHGGEVDGDEAPAQPGQPSRRPPPQPRSSPSPRAGRGRRSVGTTRARAGAARSSRSATAPRSRTSRATGGTTRRREGAEA